MPAVRGKEIRRRRQLTGMKLGEFCAAAGLSYNVLKNVESVGTRTSIEFVHKLAAALGCDAAELLAEDDAEQEDAAA